MSMAAGAGNPKVWDRKDLVPIGLFLLLFLLTFHEFLFTDKTIFDRDVTLWEIPARKLCTQLLREGSFALWTDAYGGGQPFLANLKTAALYPAMLLYLGLPFFLAFKLYYLIHAVLTWIGTYFLGKSYALSPRASFLGASLFIFGGMYLSSFEFYNHIAGLAWLPWILVWLMVPARRRVLRMAGLAVLWALSILAGAPEMTLITLLLAVLQVLFMVRDRGRRLALATASFSLALLISAAQLVPSFELLRQSARTSARSAEWSLEAVQLLNLPFANVLGNDRQPGHDLFWAGHFFDRGYPLYYSLYTGLAVLVLIPWALRRPRSKIILSLGASAILFLVLASGRYSPLRQVLGAVPLLSSIRYPVKFLMGTMFCISLLAAAGFDRVFSAASAMKGEAVRWGAATAGLGTILVVLSRPLAGLLGRGLAGTGAENLKDIRVSLISTGILGVLLALVFFLSWLTGWRRRLGGLLMIGIAILDPAYHNRHINPLIPTSFFEATDFGADHPQSVRVFRENDVPKSLRRGSTDILCLARYARRSAYPLTGAGDGLFYLFDEDTLDIYPKGYLTLRETVITGSREDRLKILRTEGCQYYVSHSRLPGLPARELDSGEGPIFFHKLLDRPVSVRVVHDSIVTDSFEERVRVCLGKDFDPELAVLVDTPRLQAQSGPPPGNDTIEALESRQGIFQMRVAVARPAIVVFPGNLARGWQARVDGRAAEVFRANLSSKGVSVPPGRHRVELKYRPASFRVGAFLSALSLLGLAGLVVVSTRGGRRGAKPGCLDAARSL